MNAFSKFVLEADPFIFEVVLCVCSGTEAPQEATKDKERRPIMEGRSRDKKRKTPPASLQPKGLPLLKSNIDVETKGP